jgi:hypothetical protein
MDMENNETPVPEEKAPESKPEEKAAEKESVAREAAHAAADVEVSATIELAKIQDEAKKLAKIAGEEAAQKWFEAKEKEIVAAANASFAEMKKTFEDRISVIEGKLKPPEVAPAASPEKKPENAPAALAAPSERPKRKRLFI